MELDPMDEAAPANRRRGFELLYRLMDLDSFDDSDWKDLLVLTTHPHQYFRIIAAELHASTGRQESVRLLAIALFDRVELVAEEAAWSLAKIGTEECVGYVRRALLEDLVDRPHYLTNALAHMGNAGYEALLEAVHSSSPTLRCHAARGLGSTLREEVVPLLQRLLETDHAESKTGARVSTAAKNALKTIARVTRAREQSPKRTPGEVTENDLFP